MADENTITEKHTDAAGPASPPAGEPETQDLLFFNVMPKNKAGGGMVEPQMQVQAITADEKPASSSFNFGEFFKKYKIYIIGVVALLILAPLVYFLIQKFFGVSSQTQNYLAPRPVVSQTASTTPAAPVQSTSTPVQGPDFTTPQAWRDKYFPGCTDPTICGDDADPDHDGLSNLQEYQLGTDPNNPDSDQDGIADGDEQNVFGSNPLSSHTNNNPKYSDADFVRGGFSFITGQKLTPAELKAISAKMKSFGLHEPTISTFGTLLNTLYGFSPPASTTTGSIIPNQTASTTIDESLAAKQSRDTKRSDTIKNIEIALVNYYSDNKVYPDTADFSVMYADIKPYLKVATDPTDPINQSPYVYSYAANPDASDFALSFYSEVAAAPISKNAADAQKDAANEQADIYDTQRETDLENLRTALLLYSNANVSGSQTFVFPTKAKYASSLVPNYISAIPKDPVSGQDYDYEPSATFDAFTLKATLQDPPAGNTGYICNQVDDCTFY